MNVTPTPLRSFRPSLRARPRVLVAEDDDDLRLLFARALEEAGFQVHTAADGLEVIGVVPSVAPDVLVMDVRMPKRSGLDVLRALRMTGCGVPVVLVTGYGDPTLRAAAADLGAAVVLDKPIDREDLLAVVELLVGHSQTDE